MDHAHSTCPVPAQCRTQNADVHMSSVHGFDRWMMGRWKASAASWPLFSPLSGKEKESNRGVEDGVQELPALDCAYFKQEALRPARPRRHSQPSPQMRVARPESDIIYHAHRTWMGWEGGVCNCIHCDFNVLYADAVRIHPDGTDTRQSPAHRRRLARSTRAPRGTDTGARAICGPCAGGREGHCAVNSFLSLGLLCFDPFLRS